MNSSLFLTILDKFFLFSMASASTSTDAPRSSQTKYNMGQHELVRLDRFNGSNFKRWQHQLKLILTTFQVAYVLTDLKPASVDGVAFDAQTNWERDNLLCKEHILNSLSDTLLEFYEDAVTAKEIWDALLAKFSTQDAGAVYSTLDWPEEEWNRLIATNLTGAFLVAKYVCTRMRDAKLKGSVINISSIAGLNRGQLPGGLAYGASKAGVNTMTKIMAMELGVYKIRVNSISPGLFKSEITEALMQKEWLNNVASRTVPLRTYGTSDPALTSLVQYLIHDSSEYVSGNVFIVDAGATLPGIPIFSSL